MNGNAELLNFIYQNSQMGVDTIRQLMDIVQDAEFNKHLGLNIRNIKKSIQQPGPY